MIRGPQSFARAVFCGHEIRVWRTGCKVIGFRVWRLSDGYPVADGFTDEAVTARKFLGQMKTWLEREIAPDQMEAAA